jgi:hypothetical protein
MLALYSSYYNQTRTHLALRKDAPLRRAVQGSDTIMTNLALSALVTPAAIWADPHPPLSPLL